MSENTVATLLACHRNFPRYVVSSAGEVISMVRKRPRVLRPIARGQYLGFTLLDDTGRLRPVYLHRLVAETFHGEPLPGHQTRHLDGDRHNNSAANLSWGTPSENMRDKEAHGTAPQGERHPMAKLTEREVAAIRRLHRLNIGPQAVMKRFGISRMTHWRIVNNKLWRNVA